MSDKLDPKHIDQDWQKMFTILEQELPQKEKKRRGFWWFGIPLLFIALSITAVTLWNTKPHDLKSQALQSSETTTLSSETVSESSTHSESLRSESSEISVPKERSANLTQATSAKSSEQPSRKATTADQASIPNPQADLPPTIPEIGLSFDAYNPLNVSGRPLSQRNALVIEKLIPHLHSPVKTSQKQGPDPQIVPKWDISLFLGGNIKNNNTSPLSALHEIGAMFHYYLGPSTSFNAQLGFESKTINPLEIENKFFVYRENGLISHSVIEKRGFGITRSAGVTLGIDQKLGQHLSLGTGIFLHRNFKPVQTRSQVTVFSFQQNGEVYQPKSTPTNYRPEDLINSYNMGAALTASYSWNKTTLSLVYKQGLTDFTNNRFFGNQVKNYTQYLGLRAGYVLFTRQLSKPSRAITLNSSH